jgi:hypothetical protein
MIPHECIPAASTPHGVELSLLLAVPFTGAKKSLSDCDKTASFTHSVQKSCTCDCISPFPSLQKLFLGQHDLPLPYQIPHSSSPLLFLA